MRSLDQLFTPSRFTQPVKQGLLDGTDRLQMLNNNSLEEFRNDGRIPNPLWINDDDRPTATGA